MNHHAGAAAVGEPATVPPTAGSRSSITEAERAGHRPITSIEPPPRPDPMRAAVEFAAAEAVRHAEAGASAQGGAHELLRWASRRRGVLELAVVHLGEDDRLTPPIRDAAIAILERALAVGLLF